MNNTPLVSLRSIAASAAKMPSARPWKKAPQVLKLAAVAMALPSLIQAEPAWRFDPSFQRTPLVTSTEFMNGVNVLSSGKVLLHSNISANLLTGANGQRIGALVRMDPDTGAIDPSWNPDPRVLGVGFTGVAEAPDGKVYYSTALAGEAHRYNQNDPTLYRLIRLNVDGSRDTTFNSPVFGNNGRFLGVQPDGKVIVSGNNIPSGNVPQDAIVQTVRLNTDGSVDTTFQTPNFQRTSTEPAITVTNYRESGVFGNPVIDPATGKIYFCGTFLFVNGQPRKGIVRCNANGTLDSTFVPTGLIGGTTQLTGRAMILQAGGKVVLGGTQLRTAAGGATRYALLRFNNDGTLDSSFTLFPTTTSSGTAFVQGYTGPRDIRALPGGKILTSDLRVLRFLPDGGLDSSFTPLDFNGGGASRFGVNATTGAAFLASPGPGATLNGVPVGNVTKLTPAGTIDQQFVSPVPNVENFAPAVQLGLGGAVYVSGWHNAFGATADATIARLRADGTRDPSYALDSLPSPHKRAGAVAFLPDGSSYVSFYAGTNSGGGGFSNLVRLLPTGAIDTTFRPSLALQDALGVNAFDGNDWAKYHVPSIFAAPNQKFYAVEYWSAQDTVSTNGNLKPMRINADGTEDTTMPALGFAVGDVTRDNSGNVSGGSTGHLTHLGPTGDGGHLLVATAAPFPTSTGNPYNYRIIKMRADGSRDPNFNSISLASTATPFWGFPIFYDPQGNFYQPVNGFYEIPDYPIASATMMPDGGVLLTGRFRRTGGSVTYSLMKLTATGELDSSFTLPDPAAQNTANPARAALITNARVAPDGKIWVVGRFDTFGGAPAPGIMRLNPNGSLDPTFQLSDVGHYDSFNDATDVVFPNGNTAYLVGTFRRPGEPMPFAVTRITNAPITQATNTSDSGPGSLRDALANAQDGDTITFGFPAPRSKLDTPAVTTINLTSGPLVIDKNITIRGPGADLLTIARANGIFRVFHVTPGHTVTIEALTIAGGNVANGTGAGIYNDHSALTVNGCTFSGNIAGLRGGGIANDGSGGSATLNVSHCTFRNNGADPQSGAAIDNDASSNGNASVTVTNSTFSANGGGAGIYNRGGALTIANSTFHKNSTANIASANGGTVNIGNTILRASAAGPNILSFSSGAITSHGFNLSSDNGGGFLVASGDQINTDPMLGPLKNNGGPTHTHAPLINSPAIDRGKRDAIPALATDLDQRGFTRPIDDPAVANAPSGDSSDVGAVELAVGVRATSASSWRTHGSAGSFPIDLPLTGPVGVECRTAGANNSYQAVITFAAPVALSSAGVTNGSGAVENVSSSGNQITVNLTGITDVQTITLALYDVSDGANTSDVGIRMGVLVGDTNGNRSVNSSDIGLVKTQAGATATAANFRADINASGSVTASDIGLVKAKAGASLPP